MKLTSVVRLQPTDHQYRLLLATLETANAACNAISNMAWEVKQFGRVPVHRLAYASIREAFGLTAQLAVRWAFNDLQQKIAYKAKLAGIPVALVDPRNSSRTCPACGHVDKANRPSQDKFLCTQCGCAGHADYFASVEIGRRAAVNPPNAVYVLGETPATTASLRL